MGVVLGRGVGAGCLTGAGGFGGCEPVGGGLLRWCTCGTCWWAGVWGVGWRLGDGVKWSVHDERGWVRSGASCGWPDA